MTSLIPQRNAHARRRWRLGIAMVEVLGLALLLVGCGSAEPKYYVLVPSPGKPLAAPPMTVEVHTPVVADYLKRDDIVLNRDGYQLHLAQNAAWGEPLPKAISQNLVLDLGQRLPNSNIYSEYSRMSSTADAVVDVSISQFAEDDAGRAEIVANVSVHQPNDSNVDARPLQVVMPLKDTSVGTLVGSMSQLIGQMADVLAQDLHALGPARSDKAVIGR